MSDDRSSSGERFSRESGSLENEPREDGVAEELENEGKEEKRDPDRPLLLQARAAAAPAPAPAPAPEEEEEKLIRRLGEGAQGVVELKRWKGKTVVIKTLKVLTPEGRVQKRMIRAGQNECGILSILKEHCADYFMCLTTCEETPTSLRIITEFLGDYESLLDWVKAHPKPTAAQVFVIATGAIRGLKKLHALGVAHRDIKFENVMINKTTGNIVYIDFGFSATVAEAAPALLGQGTAVYMDPLTMELIDQPTRIPRDPSILYRVFVNADNWALGCMLLELLMGVNEKSLAERIEWTAIQYSLPVPTKMMFRGAQLVKRAWGPGEEQERDFFASVVQIYLVHQLFKRDPLWVQRLVRQRVPFNVSISSGEDQVQTEQVIASVVGLLREKGADRILVLPDETDSIVLTSAAAVSKREKQQKAAQELKKNEKRKALARRNQLERVVAAEEAKRIAIGAAVVPALVPAAVGSAVVHAVVPAIGEESEKAAAAAAARQLVMRMVARRAEEDEQAMPALERVEEESANLASLQALLRQSPVRPADEGGRPAVPATPLKAALASVASPTRKRLLFPTGEAVPKKQK